MAICAAALGPTVSAQVTATLDLPPVEIPDSQAASESEMRAYADTIAGTEVKFEMLPIPGGTYQMGSPEEEEGRGDDEGPQREVEIEPFWMGKCEVTWNEYEQWMFSLEISRRKVLGIEPTERDLFADAFARPTKPYTDMSFGMGKLGYPAICMTQLAAKSYCEWISAKTGRYYRLPTEAEWEYACRAGTTTAYHFGDDPGDLDDYAWYFDNSDDAYHKVAKKQPNPWGLHDMHGNVAEWCVDQFVPDYFAGLRTPGPTPSPYSMPTTVEPRSVRGGSWDDDPEILRSAARRGSHKDWKKQDPQLPQSIWYYTDAQFVGFRLVRPLREYTPEEMARFGPDEIQKKK